MSTPREDNPTGNPPAGGEPAGAEVEPGDGCDGEPAAAFGSGAVVRPVFEGEVLSEAQSAEVARWFAESGTLARHWPAEVARRSAQVAGRAVGAVWRSDYLVRARSVAAYRARQAPRDLGRLSWFAIRGNARWIGKTWTFLTYGDLRADARAARLVGDSEERRAAQELIRSDSRARWAKLGLFVDRAAIAAAIMLVLALVLWASDSLMTREQMWPWLAVLYRVIDAMWLVFKTVVPILVALAPVGWIVATVYEGRDKTPGAGWLVRPDRDDADSWIDERMISQALAHLGIAPLDRFFKNGGELVYTVPARLDGNGTFAQVRLPMGVTADMV
ncbi:MAG: hypothetical protein ACRDUV_08290, partial [Pseudonocardiaceae bacterium]